MGKSFRKDTIYERMSKGELEWAKRFIKNHYHWIRPDGDVFTICVLIENGGKGSEKPAKIAKKIFNFIMQNNV